MNKGSLIVVSAPSGCGKDTIVKDVVELMKDEIHLSVSMTTREMRPGEAEGVNYFYVSVEEFKQKIESGEILEHAIYGGNYYGTPAGPVREQLESGKTVILIIEVEGGGNIKKLFPEAVKVFVIPPSFEVLEERLRGRGTDEEETIRSRLEIAKQELGRAGEYDYIIENDVLEEAVEDLISIIRAERFKTKYMINKVREVIDNA
ncbi:MAG: guanylate kinase [Clostridia bacterium]|nr:guanylate kinase [Clostridia bacterium]